jgi:glycosyltransferase involved in cell wall biosynthesis
MVDALHQRPKTVGANAFSVVTPNYNMGRYLGDTIESVLSNLRAGDEYFVIDGGSTDNSLDIIRSYEKSLSGWSSEPDRGYADALAKGFASSGGALMCWINAGDLLLPGALDRARSALEESGADCIFGDDFYIDDASRVISFSRGYVRSLHDAMCYGGWTPLQDACFWRRTLYERAGGINRGLRHAADYDLFLRFSGNGVCQYVPQAFSAFRRHIGQKSIKGAKQYAREREECRRRELSRHADSRLRKALLTAYYWVYVRFRAWVLHRLWDIPALRGVQVATLNAGSYR